jgi:hypothetical protein
MNSISAKNPRFSSTLALILLLTLTLTSTWVLSFRPVRLKLGDYYFKQGSFGQAVDWYEKVVRKEKLKVNHGIGNLLSYEEDLIKLKSALVPQIGQSLLKVSVLLFFDQPKGLKSVSSQQLNDAKAQRLYDSMMQQCNKRDNSINVELKERLQKAKKELKYFDVFENYKSLFKKKHDSQELEYLASMGHSLKEMILADEYFYLSPLNWVKAKELYESQLKDPFINNVDLFLKLGYLHAKFCNFNDSYRYFRKACELLNDLELQQNISRIKNSRIFHYPDDIGILPKKIISRYPFLQEISYFETKNLLKILGIEVSVKSDGYIGKTGIESPVNIIIRSAGYFVGANSQILINGKNIIPSNIGYNIIILNSKTGDVEKIERFDTSASKKDVRKLIAFINRIEKGKIVCVVVDGDASLSLSKEEGKVFEEIGAKGNLHGKYSWAHGIIGVKGSRRGEAIEAMSEKPLEICVINQKL